jgi:DNA-binding transcriptional MocR family regulator
VTVGTVSRAYAEAERRGLIYGEVGRGTYVRERTPITLPTERAAGRNFIDLAYNFPPLTEALPALSETLAEVARDEDLADLMAYRLDPGRRHHRPTGPRTPCCSRPWRSRGPAPRSSPRS